MTQTKSLTNDLKALVALATLKLLALLPLPISKAFGWLIARINYLFKTNSYHVTQTNIKLCLAHLTTAQQQALVAKSLMASGYLLAETAKQWCAKDTDYLQWIKQVNIDPALKQQDNRGLIIISPHLGNWELLYAYLAWEFNAAGIYKPPKIQALDKVIQAARERTGGMMIKATAQDVRKMIKHLKGSGTLFMLPDQLPAKGGGVFADFFNNSAYTMTLLQGMLNKTNARLAMASCVRTDSGFKVDIQALDYDLALPKEQFARFLNAQLEQVILPHPEQYEWAYKRFKVTPEGLSSPY
jgi:Kdo2-lipid IVA lauroyltransferase/acyltransferase